MYSSGAIGRLVADDVVGFIRCLTSTLKRPKGIHAAQAAEETWSQCLDRLRLESTTKVPSPSDAPAGTRGIRRFRTPIGLIMES
jgi:hypothetical protein